MRGLGNRVAIVTGAGSGIGRATVGRLAAEGAVAVVVDRHADRAAAVVAELESAGGRALAIVADLADPDRIPGIVDECLAARGRLDIVVNNAGVNVRGSAEELEPDGWDTVMDNNLRTAWLMMKHALPHLPRGGSIVNVASVQGVTGFRGSAGYAASKGGMLALTRQVAVDAAARGIRVNAVAPGIIATPMNVRALDAAPERAAAIVESWNSFHALGRTGLPEEVAAAIAFLASDDASFITGACLPVDGGLTAMAPGAPTRSAAASD